MTDDPWWRDPKYNKYVDVNGRLDFSGMYQKTKQKIANPLAPILGGIYNSQIITTEKILREVEYKHLRIKAKIMVSVGRGRVKKSRLEGICLGQDELIPINSKGVNQEGYNGYTIKKKDRTNRVYIRRYKESKIGNSLMIEEFDDCIIKNINSLIGKLFQDIKKEKLKVSDIVSTEIAKYLHQLWYVP